MKTPPNKLWQLLELAYADFKSIESDPEYRINMFVYHKATQPCTVCMAGAVMARTLGVSKGAWVLPGDFGEWYYALREISDIALGDFPFVEPEVVRLFTIQNYTPYSVDSIKWHNYITGLIQLLKELDV